MTEPAALGRSPYRLAIPADLAQVATVREWLGEVGRLGGLPASRVFDLQVAASEAVANGIEHASSRVEIVAWILPDRLLVEISNDGLFAPGIYKDREGRRRGLGLPLMVSLADHVHVSRLPGNQTKVSLTFLSSPGEPQRSAGRGESATAGRKSAKPGIFGSGRPGGSLLLLLLLLLLPLPLLIIAVGVLYAAGIGGVHESAGLLTAFNTLFTCAAGLLVAYLAARTYLVGGSLGHLTLGCGAIVLALGSLLAGPLISEPNDTVTVHNISILVSGALFAVTGFLALGTAPALPEPAQKWKLALPYAGSVAFAALIAALTVANLLPAFFVPGAGYTATRVTVLGAGVLFFLVATVCFVLICRRRPSRFALFAAASFASFAVAMAVLVLAEPLTGSPINWLARAGTWLGGLYLLAGALSVDYARSWLLPLERDLQETRGRYEGVVEANPDAVWIRSEGKFAFANAAAAKLLGFSSVADMLGRDVDETFHAETRDLQRERVAQVYAGGISPATDETFVRADGSTVDVSIFRTRVEYGGRLGIQAVVRDITERVRAEHVLRESEELSAFLLKLTDTLRPLSDPTAVQETSSRLVGEHLKADRVGYFEIEGDDCVIERDWAPSVPHLSGRFPVAAFGECLMSAYQSGRTVVMNNIAQEPFTPEEREAYSRMQVAAQISVPLIKNGEFVGGLTVHSAVPREWTSLEKRLLEETAERTRAIVELTKAEAALRQSEEKLSAVLQNLPVGIWIVDSRGSVTTKNRAADLIWGGDAPLSEGQTEYGEYVAWDVATGTQLKSDEYPLARTLRTGLPVTPVELRIRRFDGAEGVVVMSTAPFQGPDGLLAGAVGINIDITEPKKAEASLRESEERLRAVVENTHAVILRIDPDGIITFANRQALDFFGYSADELIGKHVVGTIVPPLESSGRDLAKMVEQILASPDVFGSNQNENMCKDGRRVWLEWTNSGIYTSDGRLKESLSVGIDITKRKQAEEELKVQNEELRRFNRAAVGRELRIIELKREVNELLEALGQARRYSVDTAETEAGPASRPLSTKEDHEPTR